MKKSGTKIVGNREWESMICCRMIDVRINRDKGSLLLPVQGYCNVVAFAPTCAGEEGVDHLRHPTTPHGASTRRPEISIVSRRSADVVEILANYQD
jgi:hypothetical protein